MNDLTVTDYLDNLDSDKETLVNNLLRKGVRATTNETFTTLSSKVADIEGTSVIDIDLKGYYTTDIMEDRFNLYLEPDGIYHLLTTEEDAVNAYYFANGYSRSIKKGVHTLAIVSDDFNNVNLKRIALINIGIDYSDFIEIYFCDKSNDYQYLGSKRAANIYENWYNDSNTVLGINNDTPYTPTDDYNPATKKYVDDKEYALPIASNETLGGIKIGDNLEILEDGTLNAKVKNNAQKIVHIEFKVGLNVEDWNIVAKRAWDSIKLGYQITGSMQKWVIYVPDHSGAVTFPLLRYENNVDENTGDGTVILYFEGVGRMGGLELLHYGKGTITINVSNFEYESYIKKDIETVQPLTKYTRVDSDTKYGQALPVGNTTPYTPKENYNPATKKYVDDSVNNLSNTVDETLLELPQNLVDNGFDYRTGVMVEKQVNYTVENISTTYGFVLNDNGYYESNNKAIGNSYSLCKVIFNNDYDSDIIISYISSGENSYDYGIFSKIDTTLSNSYTDDGSTGSGNVFKNCKGESSTEVKELTYNIPAGEHFIYIKYRKDSSGNSDNDSLQFKIPESVIAEIIENRKISTTKYVDDSVNTKQNKLTAGDNITIDENNVISAQGGGGGGGSNIQYTEMPEADASNVGNVIQYIGETNDQFTKGKFYTVKATTIKTLNKINYNGPEYLVDTPIKLGANYKIEIKADISNSTNDRNYYLIQCAGNDLFYALLTYYTDYRYNINGNGTYNTNSRYSPINEAVYVYNDVNNTITLNGDIITQLGQIPNNANQYLRIFYKSGGNFSGSLYYCKIWNGDGELIYDAMPIKIEDKFAVYDKINGYTTYIKNNEYATEGDIIDTIIEYEWELAVKEPDILITNLKWPTGSYTYITDQKWYDLFQYIVDNVNKGQSLPYVISDNKLLPNVINNGYKLSKIRNDSSSLSQDYRQWYFSFTNLYETNCKYCTGYFYTNYYGNIVYGPSSSYKAYYDYFNSVSFITSHQSLDNYLSKTNTTAYKPSNDYNPSTKKYVDDSIKPFDNKFYHYPQEIYDKGFIYETDIIVPGEINYRVEDVSGSSYNFVLNADEYYESTNKKVQSSYALCKVIFNMNTETEVAINYINSGESSWDYGIFSQLDKTLSLSNSDDGSSETTNVKKNCKGDSSLEVRTITYVIPEGEHFIYIKYRKDSSVDNGNDSLQFKIVGESSHKKYTTEYMATKKYVDTASSRIYQDVYNAVNRLTFRRVSELPTVDISTTTIYLLGESDPYIMKAYIDESWITLGTTEINFDPDVFTNSEETYTIDTLKGNQVYKLGEITELTINNYITFDRETLIYFQSGETATTINIAEGLTHIGDCPEFTQPEGATLLTGICEKKSKYIISILNNIVLWKIIEQGE